MPDKESSTPAEGAEPGRREELTIGYCSRCLRPMTATSCGNWTLKQDGSRLIVCWQCLLPGED